MSNLSEAINDVETNEKNRPIVNKRVMIRKIDLSKAYDVIENDIRHNKAQSLYKIGGNR